MTTIPSIQNLVDQLLALENITQEDMIEALKALCVPVDSLPKLPEPSGRPYSRKVFFANHRLEIMMASWHRNFPCAPHDHGASLSAIKILRGRSHHRGFSINNNRLEQVFSERKSVGDILQCEPYQIHAMGDDSDTSSLITLHVYAGCIDDMLVFSDTHTHLVSGEAGAWLPVDSPEHQKCEYFGHCDRSTLAFL